MGYQVLRSTVTLLINLRQSKLKCQEFSVGMIKYAVLRVQNRPALVVQRLVHSTGNLGVPGSASLGGGGGGGKEVTILFKEIPPCNVTVNDDLWPSETLTSGLYHVFRRF